MFLTQECFTALIAQNYGESCWGPVSVIINCLCWPIHTSAPNTKLPIKGVRDSCSAQLMSPVQAQFCLYPNLPGTEITMDNTINSSQYSSSQGWKKSPSMYVWGFTSPKYNMYIERSKILDWGRGRLRQKEKCVALNQLKDRKAPCSCLCTPSLACWMSSVPWVVIWHRSAQWPFQKPSSPLQPIKIFSRISHPVSNLRAAVFIWFIHAGLIKMEPKVSFGGWGNIGSGWWIGFQVLLVEI